MYRVQYKYPNDKYFEDSATWDGSGCKSLNEVIRIMQRSTAVELALKKGAVYRILDNNKEVFIIRNINQLRGEI